MERAKVICPTTTMGKIKEGALIVDVRRKDEVAQANFDVPNYMHIALEEFEENFGTIPKDKEIVIVCRSGEKSLKAAYFLMNHGYEGVYNMGGGLLKWINKKFPTKGDTEALLANANSDFSQTDCC